MVEPEIQTSEDDLSADHLLLLPSFACKTTDQLWRVEIHGVAFRHQQKRIKKRLLLNLLRKLIDVPPGEFTSELFLKRVAPFFWVPRKGKKICLRVGSRTIIPRRRTRRGGHFRTCLKIPDGELAQFTENLTAQSFAIEAWAKSKRLDVPFCQGKVHVVQPHGISIITDIDDTIKISGVENRRQLLVNTFLREFRGVDGISEVYQQLVQSGASVHYVSASPWQLFEPLQEFLLRDGFPEGSVHLRTFRLTDQLLKRLGVIRRGGKTKVISRLVKRFPQRRFVLIGDSVEKDPQIYLRILQLFPEQIELIAIRLVRPEHLKRDSMREVQSLGSRAIALFQTAEELSAILLEKGLLPVGVRPLEDALTGTIQS